MADRTPPEIRFMIMNELIAIKAEESPRIHQVKIKQDPSTGVSKITFYGHTKQPNVLSVDRHTRNQAKQYYIKVFDILPVGSQSTGGYWMRSKDIIYVDTMFSRGLDSIEDLNLGNIARVAIDVQIVEEHAQGYKSAMDKLMTFFPDIEHMVFFAPTQPHPAGNHYPGLRLVGEQEDEACKSLPMTEFYRAGSSSDLGSGIWTRGQRVLLFLNQYGPSVSDYRVGLVHRHRHQSDEFERALQGGVPIPVVIFQRQGMLAPRKMKVVGPRPCFRRPALGYTAHRVRPERITEADLTTLLDEQTEIPPADD